MKKDLYYSEPDCCYKQVPFFSYPGSKGLLDIFPEGKEIIPNLLMEWQEKKETFIQTEFKPLLGSINKRGGFLKWFLQEALKTLNKSKLDYLNSNIQRLENLNCMTKQKEKTNSENWEEAVEEAKRKPILEIVTPLVERLRKLGRNFVAKCPLHEEKSPSFYVYPDTNSFYCFGCNKGGDVIEFVKYHLELDFKESVSYLRK